MGIRSIANQHLRKDSERVEAARMAPRPDNGFYGPDSITWRIGLHPGGALLGIVRGAIQVLFDPGVAESVSTHSVMRRDPLTRARRSITFFQLAAFGDTETAIRAGRTLYRVHSHINGVDSVTRQTYHATDVDYALWTHALGLLAMIDAYGQFAGGLTEQEQDHFIQENVAFAQLVGIAPEDAPHSVADCQTIIADWMPRMAVGLKGHRGIDFFVNPPYTPAWPMLVASPGLRVLTIAMARHLPPELRDLAHIHPSPITARAAEAAVWAATNALARQPLRNGLRLISPEGYGTMLQAIEADPALPLADPAIREDLHLVVRRTGKGSRHSDMERSPFVSNEAHNTPPPLAASPSN